MSANAETHANASSAELNHFATLAARWWDPEGPSKPLIAINPVRLAFIEAQCVLKNARVADIGCGGGLLSEAMAEKGAQVTALDLSPELIEVAKLHALGAGIESIDYRLQSAESLADEHASGFDVVSCMEMLEHVPDPEAVIAACVRLLRPGGVLVLSTLNRTAKAFALGIVAAEYVLNLVPKGTHRYEQFLKPAEIAKVLRARGMVIEALSGMRYTPWRNQAMLSDDASVNYILAARKPVQSEQR
jgi:2-polyprenyl-6-hydroxyphenyl methylase / 3-demethylubiquinone-9 3-methyltransferase